MHKAWLINLPTQPKSHINLRAAGRGWGSREEQKAGETQGGTSTAGAGQVSRPQKLKHNHKAFATKQSQPRGTKYKNNTGRSSRFQLQPPGHRSTHVRSSEHGESRGQRGAGHSRSCSGLSWASHGFRVKLLHRQGWTPNSFQGESHPNLSFLAAHTEPLSLALAHR